MIDIIESFSSVPRQTAWALQRLFALMAFWYAVSLNVNKLVALETRNTRTKSFSPDNRNSRSRSIAFVQIGVEIFMRIKISTPICTTFLSILIFSLRLATDRFPIPLTTVLTARLAFSLLRMLVPALELARAFTRGSASLIFAGNACGSFRRGSLFVLFVDYSILNQLNNYCFEVATFGSQSTQSSQA